MARREKKCKDSDLKLSVKEMQRELKFFKRRVKSCAGCRCYSDTAPCSDTMDELENLVHASDRVRHLARSLTQQ